MADKLMNIPSDDTQNYPFCRLQLVVETIWHSISWNNQSNAIKVPKVVKPTNKKTLLKTLRTSVSYLSEEKSRNYIVFE